MSGKVERDHWHPGFLGAMELDLLNYKNALIFEGEHQLSKEPLKMDLLIIKKLKDAVINNQIGMIFRQYNIFEFKSPQDGLTIDDYFKTVGYAYLYKGLGKTVNEIPSSELTVSLVRDTFPEGLFKVVKQEHGEIVEKYPGIYYISGIVNIPTQFILTSKLDRELHTGLRLLSENADADDVEEFIKIAGSFTDPIDRQNADALLQVSSIRNKEVFETVKRRNPDMSEVLRELLKDEIQEEFDKSTLRFIKNLMESSGWDSKKIMEGMGISPADQVRYAELL